MITSVHENLNRVAQLYDDEAKAYDGDYSDALTLGGDNLFRGHFQRIVNKLRQRNDGLLSIIDIGCGTGIIPGGVNYQVQPFLDTDDPSICYRGFDISRGMLSEARKKKSRLDLLQADMHSIPFPDNTFDLGVSGYGPFSYSLEPEIVVKEFARVIRPEGKLFIMPYTARLGSGIATGFSTAHMDGIPKMYYTEKLIKNILETGNFQNIEAVGINFFGHFIQQAVNTFAFKVNPKYVARQIRSFIDLTGQLTTNSLLQGKIDSLLSEWRRQRLMLTSQSPYDGPGFTYLQRESQLAKLLCIDPGLARHMIITADLRK